MTTGSNKNACVQPLTNQKLIPVLILVLTLLVYLSLVSIQLNIVTYPMHPEKFTRDHVAACYYHILLFSLSLIVAE